MLDWFFVTMLRELNLCDFFEDEPLRLWVLLPLFLGGELWDGRCTARKFESY